MEADAVRRPVRRENLADEVLARHRPPLPRVTGLGAVVAHHEVVPLRDRQRPELGAGQAAFGFQIGLLQSPAVDVDVTVAPLEPHLDPLAREADQPLDEGAPGAALRPCRGGRLEDDDLTPLRRAEVVDEAVREDAVRELRLAPTGNW